MRVKISIGNTEPEEAFEGLIWLDTGDNDGNEDSDNILKVYDGTKWLVVHLQ